MQRPAARLAAALIALLLIAPAVAQAHVALQPATAPAGAFVVETVRVPNEKDDASTVKVQLKLPRGFTSVSYAPVPGWTAKVRTAAIDPPIQTPDGPITTGVDTITWTATDGGIRPGQFQDFPISLLMPEDEGATLAFKALQTYSDGDVVRWIGPADADEPAATITLTAPVAAGGGHGAAAVITESAATGGHGGAGDDHDGHLALAGLVAGLLGLLAGMWALITVRRQRRAAPPTSPDQGA
mgnify:CR=1 FL=1